MVKKAIAWITLAAFLVFSWSCAIYGWKPSTLESVRPEKRAKVLVSAVQLKSGEKVELLRSGKGTDNPFQNPAPARIRGEAVVGEALSSIRLEKSMIKKPKRFFYRVYPEIITDDGTIYKGYAILKIDRKQIVIGRYVPVSIPLKEIDLLWIKKVDALGTALLYIIPIGAVVALVAISMAGFSMAMDFSGFSSGYSGSCLLVYSHDGGDYACDAEPFAGAIAQGLQRTEWSRLDHGREVDGQYRILGSNSLDETQYLDELKLVVVDHAPGVRVVPDIEGGFHTISQPIPPRQARDGHGADITGLLAGDDEVFWTGRPEEKNPAQGGEPKEELTLEFLRPAGANQVKIVADARTTLLGSYSVKSFLELYGQALPSWYAEVNSRGLAYRLFQNWLSNEELYRLHIRVQTNDGWMTKGVMYAGGPFISKEKAYALDISAVEGDVLRVKLTPAVGFWMIDSIAADYSDDLPLDGRELTAAKAVDQNGGDIRGEISLTDQKYFVMPVKADTAEFIFDAPPRAAGLERTLLLKASGYYEPHLSPAGPPRWDIITKLINQPGFTVRYAWSEFERWAAAAAGVPGDKDKERPGIERRPE